MKEVSEVGEGNMVAEAKTTGHLTGKERALRGMRYFLWVFGGGMAYSLLFFSTASFTPDKPLLPVFIQFVLVFCLMPALLAGLCVMAFRQRRPWQWLIVSAISLVLWTVFMGLA